ncbi:efflux RND transporter periplasmic adaptor subunit [Leptolyngbya sp. FACHB-16]|nr:efflux RND transporter periplasmic adaptor subunit [Leptolyngbya sp. FACHB-8]MBD2158713.1 efflux RND transporter periplasmic adaptor subunit [Leptolyngbya sp. FACHB-16]
MSDPDGRERIDYPSTPYTRRGVSELERSRDLDFDPFEEPESDRIRRQARWKYTLIGLGIGVALMTGWGAIASRRSEPIATRPTVAAPGQSVTATAVAITPVTRTLNVTGTVAATDLLPVLPEVTGLQVQRVLVSEGQTVQSGQVLAELNNSVLQAQLRQANAEVASAQATVQQQQAALAQQQATLAEAESNQRRYQQLFNQGAISQQELESRTTAATTARETVGAAQAAVNSAQAEVQSRQAQVQQLQTQLSQTVVRAPAAGVIAESLAKVGNVTSASNQLFTIIQNGNLQLEAKVPETELPQVRVGESVRVTSDSDRRVNLQGEVREIDPLVDPQTRQATVRISLPESPLLRPGLFLRAAVTVQTAQAMTIPADAVLPQNDGNSIVYVLQDDNTVRATQVDVGVRTVSEDPNQTRVEIRKGLEIGDRVVVEGAGYVRDGDRVQIVPGAI